MQGWRSVTFEREGERSTCCTTPPLFNRPSGCFLLFMFRKRAEVFLHLDTCGVRSSKHLQRKLQLDLWTISFCPPCSFCSDTFITFFFFSCLRGIKAQPCRWNSWCQISFSCRDFRGTTRLILQTESGRAEKKGHFCLIVQQPLNLHYCNFFILFYSTNMFSTGSFKLLMLF